MTTANSTPSTDLVATRVSSLPSIAEVRQRMAWMTDFRPVLLEFVQKHMDPPRHMYSFENNRYTPMTVEALQAMMASGQKPALNQDGIHNLMSLYECYADEPTVHETREDGYYICRATVKLISFRSGQPMGAGTGSCSTRESKYAYRWVYESDVPKGMDKATLRQKTFESRSGREYSRYRMDNEDLADVEATVLKMAVKRAKSAAVQALPLVSEMFSALGDADEDLRDADAARQEILKPLGIWMRGMKGTPRARAILAVFGEPLRPDDVAKLDEDRLAVALQVIEIGTKAGLDWGAATLVADLKQALATSAAKAKADLFGDDQRGSAVTHVNQETGEIEDIQNTTDLSSSASQEPQPPLQSPPESSGAAASILEPPGGQHTDISSNAWRETLEAHKAHPAVPEALRTKVRLALNPRSETTDTQGFALASAVLDAIDNQQP